jgi:hypothetical protein
MENKRIALDLLGQIIEEAEKENLHRKLEAYEEGGLERTTGESWTLFHLKALKELLSRKWGS